MQKFKQTAVGLNGAINTTVYYFFIGKKRIFNRLARAVERRLSYLPMSLPS
jgi:hypothetical protein